MSLSAWNALRPAHQGLKRAIARIEPVAYHRLRYDSGMEGGQFAVCRYANPCISVVMSITLFGKWMRGLLGESGDICVDLVALTKAAFFMKKVG